MFFKIKNYVKKLIENASMQWQHFVNWFESLKAVKVVTKIIDKPLALEESYIYRFLTSLYGSVACLRPHEKVSGICYKICQVLLFTLALSAPFLSGAILFILVQIMFVSFLIMLITGKENEVKVSDFDTLLMLFCLTILAVASVGRPILGMLSVWFVFGSFILTYIVIINVVKHEETLFYLKMLICVSGTLVGIMQLVSNIFSFELRVLGQLYVLSIPMALEMFFYTKSVSIKIATAFMSLVMFLSLIVVWSGGGWAWATAILAFFIVIRDWRLLIIGGVSLLFIPIITPFKIIDFDTISHQGIFSYIMGPSQDYRMTAIEAVGGFLDFYRENSMEGYFYASLLVIICILVLLVLLIKEILSHVRAGKTGMICAILAAVGSGVTGFLYQDIATGVFNNYRTLLLFWMFVSLYSVSARIEESILGQTKPEPVKKIAGKLSFVDIIPFMLCVSILLAALKF